MNNCNHIVGYWKEQKNCFPKMVKINDEDFKYYSVDIKFKFCPECGFQLIKEESKV